MPRILGCDKINVTQRGQRARRHIAEIANRRGNDKKTGIHFNHSAAGHIYPVTAILP